MYLSIRERVKDPVVMHGITLSSVIANTLEIVILNPILDEIGFPDMNQTAFQRGLSCADAASSMQEVLKLYSPGS